jgi:deazaflavin-dependent oxidoreductase (nitroreductase family)
MSIEKPPAGTRGGRTPPSLVNKLLMPVMMRIHRRGGDRFQGMDLLYITTVGARSGQQRTNPVARFEDGKGGWYVVASAGGAAQHPAWYHNVAAHPDQVWVQFGGTKRQVKIEQLSGDERSEVWEQVVVARAPGFGAYPQKTDREIPVLRLTPVS